MQHLVFRYNSYQLVFVVKCPNLNDVMNGELFCSLGDNGPLYGDTCSFTCNTGYELTGSDTRTCQSDGSWSGSDDVCSNSTATMSAYIIVGAVLGSLFILLILVILMCGIILLRNRRKHQLHNIAIYGKGTYLCKYVNVRVAKCLMVLQYLDKRQQHRHPSLYEDNKVYTYICMYVCAYISL